MPRASRPSWSSRAGLALTALVVVLAAGASIALMNARAGTYQSDQPRFSRPAESVGQVPATSGGIPGAAAEAVEGSRGPDQHPRTSRSFFSRRVAKLDRAEGSEHWYLGMAGIAVLLALGGGIAAAARRFAPRNGAGALQVVSRVSLSPRHTVFLLRAGGRVLLVGTGPQGAPSLISELDEIPQIEPAIGQGDEA